MSNVVSSKETEVSILGSVMMNPSIFARIVDVLKEEDFFYPENRMVYRTMINLFSRSIEINVKTVWNELYKLDYEQLTEQDLRGFLDYQVGGDTVISFATQIAEYSGLRLLHRGVGELNEDIQKNMRTLDEYASMLSNLANDITGKGLKQSLVTGKELIEDYLSMLDRDRSNISFTGLEAIDSQLVDFDAKETSFLAARPGTGKTAMMLQSARVNVEKGARVGFLSMEMDKTKLLNRMIAARAEVNGQELLNMSPSAFSSSEKLMDSLVWYSEQPLFIDDAGPWNNETVSQKIRKLVYEKGCDVVYVDYIGLIGATGFLAGQQRNQQLSEISSMLKNLSGELNIPILIASQLNRDVVKRVDQRPNLSDLRDSGALEQDASIVAFLYPDISNFNPEITQEEIDKFVKDTDEVPVKFEIAKQRNGPVFTKSLIFQKPYGKFHLKESFYASY
jgi:replicative DNA helicase